MRFDWHGPKSDRTFRERGFDFGYASRIWQGPVVELLDDRTDYGEIRIKAIGCIDGRCFSVVYTPRGDVHCIISTWPSSRKEREIWRWAYEPQTKPGLQPGSTQPGSKPPRNPRSKDT
jgi:uncharacterized DUF497 family protein